MVTVSVVIPVYNGENTIFRTLSSVLNQTFQDFEILVIDDGSTDSTQAIVESFQDPRIKIFSQPNQGVIASRNLGIQKSQGQYIAFLDADDIWLPDKLSNQVSTLRIHPNIEVVYCWNNYIDEKDQLLKSGWHYRAHGFVYPEILKHFFVETPSSLMVSQAAAKQVGGFDPELQQLEDWDFCLRLARHYEFCCVPKVGTLYRQSSGSRSTQTGVMEADGHRIINRSIAQIPTQYGFKPQQKNRIKAEAFANFFSYLFYVDFCKTRDRKASLALMGLLIRGLWSSPQVWQKIPKRWMISVMQDILLAA